MSVTNKKTDYDSNQQDHSENNGDEVAHVSKRSKHDANTDNKGSDLIEPKNEYDEDDDDDDGNVEDLTMDELEDMEPGPSNAGGSSQGELSWNLIYDNFTHPPMISLHQVIIGKWTDEARNHRKAINRETHKVSFNFQLLYSFFLLYAFLRKQCKNIPKMTSSSFILRVHKWNENSARKENEWKKE